MGRIGFRVLVEYLILVQVSDLITSRDVLDDVCIGIGTYEGDLLKEAILVLTLLMYQQDYSPSCGLCHKRRGGPIAYGNGP